MYFFIFLFFGVLLSCCLGISFVMKSEMNTEKILEISRQRPGYMKRAINIAQTMIMM